MTDVHLTYELYVYEADQGLVHSHRIGIDVIFGFRISGYWNPIKCIGNEL